MYDYVYIYIYICKSLEQTVCSKFSLYTTYLRSFVKMAVNFAMLVTRLCKICTTISYREEGRKGGRLQGIRIKVGDGWREFIGRN